MSTTRQADLLRQLESSGASDRELLARFVGARDPGAFEELVRRHGALVLGVCRRVTGHPQDAEDAFQAVFLVLAQKAGALRVTGVLGNWLYGVAYRVSLRARRAAGRRKAREVTMSNPPEPLAPPTDAAPPELLSVLDAELAALPAHYRDAIVLCDLQGASREEAATALGVPEGTLSSRLANGRKKLAARLTKHGVALSVASVPLALAGARGGTVVPAELILRTGQLATDVAAGSAVPRALTHLLNGGSAVRKMLIISATIAVAAGAVFAARPSAELPPERPKVPEPEKIVEVPKPKEVPKAKDAPSERFVAAPKMRKSLDLPISDCSEVMWDSTGTVLAVQGKRHGTFSRQGAQGVMLYSVPPDTRDTQLETSTTLEDGDRLAGLAAHGKEFVTVLRESHLISRRYQLQYWTPSDQRMPGLNAERIARSVRTVELDELETEGSVFAADMKTYRTSLWERDVPELNRRPERKGKLEVLEVDSTTGKSKVLLTTAFRGPHALSSDGKRFAVTGGRGSRVDVYDLTRPNEEPFCSHTFKTNGELGRPLPDGLGGFVGFSPDGTRLLLARGDTWATVFDVQAGRELPELEGAKEMRLLVRPYCFEAKGRLLVAVSQKYRIRVVSGLSLYELDSVQSLCVWDVDTGKVLKTWKLGTSALSRVAFCPTRPLLAILEPNGTSATRLGFWDFSAEVEKK